MSDPGANPFAKYISEAAPTASENPFAKYLAPSSGSKYSPGDLGIPKYDGGAKDAILQGATFGLSDEIGAGLSAPLQYGIDKLTGKKPADASLGDYYDANLANIREGSAEYQHEHPGVNAAGELVGGLMDFNPATVTKALAGGVKAAITKGTATGAGLGAASGFGDAQGGFENRAEGAGVGAGLGALAGAVTTAAPPAIPWLAKAGVGVRDMVSNAIAPWSKNLDDFISETAGRVLNKTAGSEGAAFESPPIPGMKPTTGQASNNPGLLWLERSIEQGSPEGAARSAESRTANNQALRDAVGQIGDLNSPADQTMREALVRGQPEDAPEDRVLDLARENLGDGNFYETGQALNAARKAQSAPLYEKAMGAGPIVDSRVDQFLSDPIMQQGLSRGLQIQRLEALAKGEKFDPQEYGITNFNAAGEPVISGVPNMRLLDAAKKGLDDTVEGYRNPITGKLNLDQYGRAVNDVRAAYVKALDQANHDYAAARASWSGPSQSLDALHAGRSIFRGDNELTAQRIANLAPGDADFYRIGVLRALDDVVNNSPNGAGALKTVLAKPNVQQKLAAAFKSPEQFESFQNSAADILNPQGDIAKATAKNSAGHFVMPESAVAGQFIKAGKGGPEALHAYLDAVGNDEAGLQAARDAFAQKLLDRVQTTVPDQEGDRVLSASKMTNFLDQYKHVVNSGLFSDDQRAMIQRIADAADMSQRTARAGAKGGPDTFAKLQGKSFLDVLVGPGASKIAPVVGTAVGAHFGGVSGAVAGAVGANYGLSKLEQALYGATRDKVIELINKAMSDPELAKALMMQASRKTSLQMSAPARRMIYSILGADTWNAGRGAPNDRTAGAQGAQ